MQQMVQFRNEQHTQAQQVHYLIQKMDSQMLTSQKANEEITEKLRKARELAKQDHDQVKAQLQMIDSANRKGPPSDIDDLGSPNPEARPKTDEVSKQITGRLTLHKVPDQM